MKSPLHLFVFGCVIGLGLFGFERTLLSQSSKPDQDEQVATIRGSFVIDSEIVDAVDWSTIKGEIIQRIDLEQPQRPATWQKMTLEQRQGWLRDYFATEAGQRIKEANQKKLDQRWKKSFQVRDEGEVVIYDVPRGPYEMRISEPLESDGKRYFLQAYGQFDVGAVDELDFSKMPLEVTRDLSSGEVAPEVVGQNEKQERVALTDFRGKPVLVLFGLSSNAGFQAMLTSIQKVTTAPNLKGKIDSVAVTLDQTPSWLEKFNQEIPDKVSAINLGKWDPVVLNAYGIRSVPSCWLIDAEGRVELTGQDVLSALGSGETTLSDLIQQAISQN